MAAGAIKAGEAYVELGVRSTIEKGLKQASSKLKRFGGSLATVGAAMTGGAIAALAAPVQMASEMEETMSKLNVVFGDNAEDMQKWSKETGRALGVTNQRMQMMAGSMQDLLVPMGLAPDQATEFTKELSKLSVDLASFNNMDPDKTFADMMSAMTGSGEVMKKYGVILNVANMENEAYTSGLAEQGAKLNDVQKAQAAFQLIMKGTTAAQGDAIRTQDSFANQTKRLWTNLKEMATILGQAVLPPLTAMLQRVNSVVKVFFEWAQANRSVVEWLGKGLMIFGAVGAALTAIGGAAGVAGVALGGITTAIGAIGTIAGVVFTPLGAVIAGITVAVGALGAAFVKAGMDTGLFGEALIHVQEIFGRLLDIGKATFQGISDAIAANDWQLAMQIAMKGMEAIVWEGLLGIYDAFLEMLPTIGEAMAKFGQTVARWAVKLAQVVQNPIGAGADVLADLLSGTGFSMAGFGGGVRESLQGRATASREELDRLVAQAAQQRAAAEQAASGVGDAPSRSLIQSGMSETMIETLNAIKENTGVSALNSQKVPVASFG